MKKKCMFFVCLLGICFFSFGLTLKTGGLIEDYTVLDPRDEVPAAYQNYVTKIAKANGYPNGVYEVQILSIHSFGLQEYFTITYILKQGDKFELFHYLNNGFSHEKKIFTVKSITENRIELEEKP